jgi:hypothetical protein
MIHKLPSSAPGHVQVVFELPPFLWADHIAVVGDFSQWCPTVTPMQQDRDGVWRVAEGTPCCRS